MPQLMLELNQPDGKRKNLTEREVSEICRAKQHEVLRKVCERFKTTPQKLAALPLDDVTTKVKAIIGEKKMDLPALQAALRSFATMK